MDKSLLAANQRFYDAFTSADIEAMDSLWAREAPVTCIHPGWTPLVSRAEIMKSWQAILTGPVPKEIIFSAPEAFPGENMGYVICNQTIGDAELIATNVFVRDASGEWKMIHHHAGPIVRRRPEAPQPKPVAAEALPN